MCATVSQGITESIDEQAYFNLIWQPSEKANPTIFARTAVGALSVWQMNNLKGCSTPQLPQSTHNAHSLCHIISAWLTLKFAFKLSCLCLCLVLPHSDDPKMFSRLLYLPWPKSFSLVSFLKSLLSVLCVGVGVCVYVWVNFAIFAHGLWGTIKIILVSGRLEATWTRSSCLSFSLAFSWPMGLCGSLL